MLHYVQYAQRMKAILSLANLDTMRKVAIISRSNFDYLIEIKTMRCVKFAMPIVLNAHSHAIDSQRKTL